MSERVEKNDPDQPGVPASVASDGSDKAAIQSAFETYKKSVDAMTEFLNNDPPDDSPFWDQMVESDKRWNESIRRIQDEAPWLAGISILPPAPQGSREFVRETYRALLRDLRGKEAEFRRLERIYAAIHQVAGKQVLLDVLRLDFRLGLRESASCASPSFSPNDTDQPGVPASVASDGSADVVSEKLVDGRWDDVTLADYGYKFDSAVTVECRICGTRIRISGPGQSGESRLVPLVCRSCVEVFQQFREHAAEHRLQLDRCIPRPIQSRRRLQRYRRRLFQPLSIASLRHQWRECGVIGTIRYALAVLGRRVLG